MPAELNERERMLLEAGAYAHKNFLSFRFAFYISVVCNIIMFILVMTGGK